MGIFLFVCVPTECVMLFGHLLLICVATFCLRTHCMPHSMLCFLITIHVAKYGSLNVLDPHNLIESSTIRRCGFVGVVMALLAEVCHCGAGL